MKIYCSCGCGELINSADSRGRIRIFKNGHNNAGSRHHMWNGGKRKIGKYLYILKHNHPFATKQGYVAEHRLIMEDRIGRYLRPDEDVHHINGVTTDNRPENLQLLTHAEHTSITRKNHALGK